jgi:hypothetical protein
VIVLEAIFDRGLLVPERLKATTVKYQVPGPKFSTMYELKDGFVSVTDLSKSPGD